MNRFLLFEADDRPERELGWTYDPSAPATEDELAEFFDTMAAILTEPEGRATR